MASDKIYGSENRRQLFDSLSKDGFDLGTFEDFNRNMDDENVRKSIHEAAIGAGWDLPDYAQFDSDMAVRRLKIGGQSQEVDHATYDDFIKRHPSGSNRKPANPQPKPQQAPVAAKPAPVSSAPSPVATVAETEAPEDPVMGTPWGTEGSATGKSNAYKSFAPGQMRETGDPGTPDYGIPYRPYTQMSAAARHEIERENDFTVRQLKKMQQEKQRRRQPLVDTGSPEANKNIIKTQGQWDDELQQGVKRISNSVVVPAVDKAIAEFDKKAHEVFESTQEGGNAKGGLPTGTASGATIFGSMRESNQAKDPEKILEYLNKQMEGVYKNETFLKQVSEEANRMGIDGAEYIENIIKPQIAADIQSRFDQTMIARELPKSGKEYVVSGLSNSIVGMLADAFLETKSQRYYKNQAEAMTEEGGNPYYNPSTSASLAKMGVSFAADAPFFGFCGRVSGQVAKQVAEREIKSLVAKGMSETAARNVVGTALENSVGARMKNYLMQHVIGGSLTMGAYNATSEAARQARDKEGVDLARLAESTAEGLAVGAAFGATGAATQALSQPLSGFSKLGAKAAGFGAEAETMYTTEELTKMLHGEDAFENPFEGSLEALEKLGVMKLSGGHLLESAGKKLIRAKEVGGKQVAQETLAQMLGQNRTGIKFTDEEQAYVRNTQEGQKLIDGLSQMHPGKAVSEVNGKKKLTKEGEALRVQLSQNYEDFMNNKDIPANVKQKVAGVLGGIYRPGLETGADIIQNEDGSVLVKTRDKDGNCVQDLTFDNLSEAEQWRDSHLSECRRNDAVNMWNSTSDQTRQEIVNIVRDNVSGKAILDEMKSKAEGMKQNRLKRQLEKINQVAEQYEGRELTDEEARNFIQMVIRDGDEATFGEIYQLIHDMAYPKDMPDVKRNYWEGQQLSTMEKHSAHTDAQLAKERLMLQGEDFAKEVMNDAQYPDEKISELAARLSRGYITKDQFDAAVDYYNKMSKVNGMFDETLKDIDNQVEAANSYVRKNTHADSGSLIDAVYVQKPDRQYYVTAGHFEVTPDGKLKPTDNSGMVILRDKETGEIEVVSPSKITVSHIDDPNRVIAENESMEGLRGQLMKEADDVIDLHPDTPTEAMNGDIYTGADGNQYMVMQIQDEAGNPVGVKIAIDETGNPVGNPMPFDMDEYRKAKSNEIDAAERPQEKTVLPEDNQVTTEPQPLEEPAAEAAVGAPEQETKPAGGEASVEKGTGVNEPSAAVSPKVPVDEKGKKLYEQAKPEDALADLTAEFGEEDAQQMITQMVENTDKALKALQEQDTSDMTDMNDIRSHMEKIKELQKKRDFWQGLVKNSTEADEQKIEAGQSVDIQHPSGESGGNREDGQDEIQEQGAGTQAGSDTQQQQAEGPKTDTGVAPVSDTNVSGGAPVTEHPAEPTAEQKVAQATVKKNIGKRYEFTNQDGTHSELVIDSFKGDDTVTVTRQDYDANGNPNGEPYNQDLKYVDVGNSIINGYLKPSLSVEEKLREAYKNKVGMQNVIDVLSEKEQRQLLEATEKGDYEALKDLTNELVESHREDIILNEREKRNSNVRRIMEGNGSREEKLRKVRKEYQGYDEAVIALSDEAMQPSTIEEYVANLHSQLPDAIQEQYSDQDVLNAILSVFGGAERPSDITTMVIKRGIIQAEQAARRMEEMWIDGPSFQKVVEDNSFANRLKRGKESVNTEPTEGQKQAGNYKKGHISFGGYDFTIENPEGSMRRGTDATGRKWEQKMNNTYGYILGKYGKDGDHLDMFINDAADLDNWNGTVYVVDQVDPKTGKWDEHKVLYGFDSLANAKKAYLSNYEEGWKGLGKITGVTKEGFDKWLDSSERKLKQFADHSIAKEHMVESEHAGFDSSLKQLNTKGISINDPELMKEYGLKDITLSKTGDHVTLNKIVVENQGQGNGTRFMEDLARLADEKGLTLALTPSGGFGAKYVKRLKDFYKRFGFADNKGRNADFYTRESMIRRPKETVGANTPERQEQALRDAVVEHLRSKGIEVSTDWKLGQKILDDYNSRTANREDAEGYEVKPQKVTDQQTLDELNKGKTVKRYRAMQLIDGKLYPPMSAKVDGEMRQPTEIGVWEQSEERPDLIKNGKFVLNKGQKGQGSVPAAYNPYFHTSTSGLNDQFTSAYKRPELVVVEVDIPESELTSGYKAEGAKDAVGNVEWHSGVVNGQLPADRQRQVTLSRYNRVNRVVPDSEVADMIAKQLEGTNVEVPYNVVTPQLRKELEARGVKISDKPAGSVTEDINGNPIEKGAKYFKTGDGHAYGYTMGGKIYVDPRIATSETPIHEYGHLYCAMKRQTDPEGWNDWKQVMFGDKLVQPIIDKVRRDYPELSKDGKEDDFAEEIITQFSGKRGSERLREIADEVAKEKGGVFGKAEAITAMQRLKSILNRFWEGIAKMMGWKYTNANQIADRIMADMLNGVDPTKMAKDAGRLRPQAEIERTLMGVHNLSEDKLRKVLKQGGLANPSLAVIDTKNHMHTDYGAISLIPKASLIDSRTGRNAGTFTADAWTPTYPQVQKRMSSKGQSKFWKDIRTLNDEAGEVASHMRMAFDTWLDKEVGQERLAYWYMKERGMNPELILNKNPYGEDIVKRIDELTDDGNLEVSRLPEDQIKEIADMYHAYKESKGEPVTPAEERIAKLQERIDPNKQSPFTKLQQFRLDELKKYGELLHNLNDFAYAVGRSAFSDGKPNVDATIDKASKALKEQNLEQDFDKWLQEKADSYGIEEWLYNGTDYQGRQKWVRNTLGNASKLMKKDGLNGAKNWSSIGNWIAKVANKEGTLGGIRKNKQNLNTTKEQHQAFHEEWGQKLHAIADKLGKGDWWSGENILGDALEHYKNISGYLKREYDYDLSAEDRKTIDQFVNEVQNNFPTGYFETKFERPVMLDEFEIAVVPENTSPDIVEALKNAGLDVRTYDDTGAEDQKDANRKQAAMEAVQGRDDIMFQMVGREGADRADKAEGSDERSRNLTLAEDSEKAGVDAKAIKLATGWERGADGQWRYEIPDADRDILSIYQNEFKNVDKEYQEKKKKLDALTSEWDKQGEELLSQIEPDGKGMSRDEFNKRLEPISKKVKEMRQEVEHLEKLRENLSPILKLGDLLGEDNELFKYYPEMKKMQVMFDKNMQDGVSGSFDGSNISINAREAERFGDHELNNENIYGTLLHEVQHAIQDIEGFAQGGNLNTSTTDEGINAIIEKKNRQKAMLKQQLDANRKILNNPEELKAAAELENKSEKEVKDNLLETINTQAAEYDTIDLQIARLKNTKSPSRTDAMDLYRRLAGEVEARNVTERMGMNGEQQRQSLASETEDVPRDEQVIIMGDGTAMNINDIKPVGKGDFGDIYDQFKGKPKEAIDFLTKKRGGDVLGVFNRKEVGDIDLVWGYSPNPYKGKGLSHIIRKHIETLHDFKDIEELTSVLDDVVNNGEMGDDYAIEKDGYRVVIAKEKDGKRWILTAFDNNKKTKEKASITSLNTPSDVKGEGAVSPDASLSGDKDTKNINTLQENKQKSSAESPKFQKVEQPIFVSNAMRAVEAIKQDKATPEQWLKMIEKGGGLKAGEDKWIGLSDWLNSQKDKKSLTKQEVMDYIRQNQIEIEDWNYEEFSYRHNDKLKEFNDEFRDLMAEGEEETGSVYTADHADWAFNQMKDKYGDDFEYAFDIQKNGDRWELIPALDWNDELSGEAKYYLGAENTINGTRLEYTTQGLDNKREIALVVPTIESYNEGDHIHFGDAGEGRAVAWVRFGDTTIADNEANEKRSQAHEARIAYEAEMAKKYGVDQTSLPSLLMAMTKEERAKDRELADAETAAIENASKARKKVLVIDEIQSKRHQDAREHGYMPTIPEMKKEGWRVVKAGNTWTLYDSEGKKRTYAISADNENDAWNRALEILKNFNKTPGGKVPGAPFEKNWHELAMKRMLRYAAENGYDKIAWTTGAQQAERYNMSESVDEINATRLYDGRYEVEGVKDGERIFGDYYPASKLPEMVGKELADKIINGEDNQSFKGDDLRVGGHGMEGFYDQILPRFMDKYGKKWGVKTGEVELPDLERSARKMHSIDVTPEMKESVMQGQPMFQRVGGPESEMTPEDRQYWNQWDAAMKKWKERNAIPADQTQAPEKPKYQQGENALDYAQRLVQWNRMKSLWQTAPKLEDYRQVRDDRDIVEAARQNEQRYPDSPSAKMRRVASDMMRIQHAMSRQKAYDKATVKAVTDFAQDFMKLGFGDNLSRGEMERMLSSVKNATGAKDIKKNVDNIMNILIDNHLRNLDQRVQKLSSTKELSKTAQGVEKQGRLELKGQRMIQAFRDAREKRMTLDQINERMADVAEKMNRSDDEAPMWEQEYEGLSIARQYVENIEGSREEWADLDTLYKYAVKDYKTSGRSYKDQQEYLESLEQAMQENKIERIGYFGDIIGRLEGNIAESMQGAKEFVEREKQRVKHIQDIANFDLAGKDMGTMRDKVKGKPANFFLQPLGTFEQMLKQFGSRNANGEGYLYDYFMRNWMDATDKAFINEQKAKEELDAKAREVFGGKVKRWSDLYDISRSLPTMDVEVLDGEEPKTFKLTQGNLLYIYMADKMVDGRMKLRKMGIDEDAVEKIKDFMDPRLVQLGDWLQGEYLPQKRTEYNKVHERMFGAPMAAIDNYFPLKVLGDARYQEQDVNVPDSETLPSTITGNIIKRRKNALPLDILHTDALSLAIEHVEDMERWAAQAEWNKDINTLLSYTTFRNKVKNMDTIYGSGDALWNSFKDAAKMAAGTYNPSVKPGHVDAAISNIAKGVTAAKINFRVYTAFKQLLSAPAFLHDVNLADFAHDAVNPYGSWKWAMENMPVFQKRWKSRQVGDTRLMDDPTDWKLWKTNIVQMATRLGMSPNALVDGVTCAVGARSIYKSRYKKYKEIGASDEVAHKRALQDAEIGYNLTQQSSEGAFVSAIQKDRTVAANMLSVFRNSSMAYTRQWVDAARNLKKRSQKGYKEDSIKFMARQMQDQFGLDEAQAKRAAELEYAREGRRDVARLLNMMFGVTVAWNLGASLPYLLIGDDDNTKKEMLTDALMKGLLAGPTEGLAAGNLYSDFIGRTLANEQTRNTFKEEGIGAALDNALKQGGDYEVNPLPLMADLQGMIKKMGYDKYAAAQDVFNIVMQSAVGVNPQTFTDMWNAIMDYTAPGWDGTSYTWKPDNMANSKELALFMMRLMNAPTSSWRNKYIDELGMNAEDAQKLPYEEMARRYAHYKHWKDAPIMGWLRGEEARNEKIDKMQKQFDDAVSERMGRLTDDELMHNVARSESAEEKRRYAKMIAQRLGLEPGEDSQKADEKKNWYQNLYQQKMLYEDIKEDEMLADKYKNLENTFKEKREEAERKSVQDLKEFNEANKEWKDRIAEAKKEAKKRMDWIRGGKYDTPSGKKGNSKKANLLAPGKKQLENSEDAEAIMKNIRQWRKEALEILMRAESDK